MSPYPMLHINVCVRTEAKTGRDKVQTIKQVKDFLVKRYDPENLTEEKDHSGVTTKGGVNMEGEELKLSYFSLCQDAQKVTKTPNTRKGEGSNKQERIWYATVWGHSGGKGEANSSS